MDNIQERIEQLLKAIDKSNLPEEPYQVDLKRYRDYKSIIEKLKELSSKIDDISIEDANDRLYQHMIIVTWKVNRDKEIQFSQNETEILGDILVLCDDFLVCNDDNTWSFFVTIYKHVE